MDNRKLIASLLYWFIGMPIIIALSFVLRQFGEPYSLGMPEALWFSMHLGLFVISFYNVYLSLSHLELIRKSLIMLAVFIVYGLYYFSITWLYIVESGIDAV